MYDRLEMTSSMRCDLGYSPAGRIWPIYIVGCSFSYTPPTPAHGSIIDILLYIIIQAKLLSLSRSCYVLFLILKNRDWTPRSWVIRKYLSLSRTQILHTPLVHVSVSVSVDTAYRRRCRERWKRKKMKKITVASTLYTHTRGIMTSPRQTYIIIMLSCPGGCTSLFGSCVS